MCDRAGAGAPCKEVQELRGRLSTSPGETGQPLAVPAQSKASPLGLEAFAGESRVPEL